MGEPTLTERQIKWMASVRASLEQRTGKTLEQWVAIARTCPETGERARVKWFKDVHGLLQNSAMFVLSEAFPEERTGGWSEPQGLRNALWTDAQSKAIFEKVEAAVRKLPKVVTGQRKGYSAWSREFQFVSVRPIRGGKARLGLAVDLAASPRLIPARNEGWSERLKASVILDSPTDVDAELEGLIRQSWERS